jgi:dipeptidyl aminopeptidase/acylaminoacyl peptidase
MPWRGLGGEMEKGGKGERRKAVWCAVVVAVVVVGGVGGVEAIAVKEVRQVTSLCENFAPSWIPDGRIIFETTYVPKDHPGYWIGIGYYRRFPDNWPQEQRCADGWMPTGYFISIIEANGFNQTFIKTGENQTDPVTNETFYAVLRGRAPSWHKLKDKIFYFLNDVLYSINPNGTDLQVVYRGDILHYSVSPDGENLIIGRGGGRGGPPIKGAWSVIANGSYLITMELLSSKNYPIWSPDGKKISYWGIGEKELWTIDATRIQAAADREPGIPIDEFLGAKSVGPASYNYGAGGSPLSWSPNGEWIVFASKKYGNLDIFAVKEDGSELVRLTNNSSDDFSPAWSPDGVNIAFVRNNQIFVMNLDLAAPSDLEPIPPTTPTPTTTPTLTPTPETPGFSHIAALFSIAIIGLMLAYFQANKRHRGRNKNE